MDTKRLENLLKKLEGSSQSVKSTLVNEVKGFAKELKDLARTTNEPCPEGHALDTRSGRCLPTGSLDHTAFTRSANDDQGPLWRGLQDKQNKTFASDDEELVSCPQGTTFSFVKGTCISLEEAEKEDSGNEQADSMPNEKDPSGRKDPTGFKCPPNQYFDFNKRMCVSLDSRDKTKSAIIEAIKEDAHLYGAVFVTPADIVDGHRHFATLDEEGNGHTSSTYSHGGRHCHVIKDFQVVPMDTEYSGESYTSKHLGFVQRVDVRVESLDMGEVQAVGESETMEESASELTSKDRTELPSSSFGVPSKRKFPLNDCGHVKNAMSRFNQAKGLSSDEKASLKRKILTAARKCGIKVDAFAKAQTDQEYANINRLAIIERYINEKNLRVEDATEEYVEKENTENSEKKEKPGFTPCPPFLVWDKAAKKCVKGKAKADTTPEQKDPEGRKDPVGFKCGPGWFFDFLKRECVPLDPSKKPQTTTEKAANDEGLTQEPKGKGPKVAVDCPKGTLFDLNKRVCIPLDPRKKIASIGEALELLDAVISNMDEKEVSASKAKVEARYISSAAFPPSLVSEKRRSLMHHGSEVQDPNDHDSVDVVRLRNALARIADLKGYSEEELASARNHLLEHVNAVLSKKA